MMKNSIKKPGAVDNCATSRAVQQTLSSLILLLFSIQAFANETIHVRVKTNEKVAALGFIVEGKKSGMPGQSYTGKGPANKKYTFGYRKQSAFGPDITCGSEILSK